MCPFVVGSCGGRLCAPWPATGNRVKPPHRRGELGRGQALSGSPAPPGMRLRTGRFAEHSRNDGRERDALFSPSDLCQHALGGLEWPGRGDAPVVPAPRRSSICDARQAVRIRRSLGPNPRRCRSSGQRSASTRSPPGHQARGASQAGDLATWRSACGDPPDSAPVIPDRRGEPWADYDWDNWHDRTFRSAAGRGWPTRRPRGRPEGGPPPRPAIELCDAAHLRTPAAP
jgi:hypothetical protein